MEAYLTSVPLLLLSPGGISFSDGAENISYLGFRRTCRGFCANGICKHDFARNLWTLNRHIAHKSAILFTIARGAFEPGYFPFPLFSSPPVALRRGILLYCNGLSSLYSKLFSCPMVHEKWAVAKFLNWIVANGYVKYTVFSPPPPPRHINMASVTTRDTIVRFSCVRSCWCVSASRGIPARLIYV